MDIESIKTFITLADNKNFTRTASQLFISQSTVTNRINELEKELGNPLFIRTNRSVELTTTGEQFYEYADKVLHLTDTYLSEINSQVKYENHIRIASSDSIYEGHLAPIIIKHKKKNPNDSLKITIGLSSHLIEQMLDNIYDVLFTYIPINKQAFHCEIFRQDKMILVTDYNNKNFKNGIKLEELIEVNYLMCNFALQNVGQFIRNLFPKYHQFSLEIDDCSKIIPFILLGECYTFLPHDMAKPYIKDKTLRQVKLIDLEPPVINSYIICKKSKWDVCQKIFM